jgi:hypothetical protein
MNVWPLLKGVPARIPSHRSSTELTKNDEGRVAVWKKPFSTEFGQSIATTLANSTRLETIPFGVAHLLNRELGVRSLHRFKDYRPLLHMSATGFLAFSSSPLHMQPANSVSTCLTLDPEPVPFDASNYPLGHMRGEFTLEQWEDVRQLTEKVYDHFNDDMTQLPYKVLFGLSLFAAIQDFLFRFVSLVIQCGINAGSVWAERLRRELDLFDNGQQAHRADIAFLSTWENLLFLNFNTGSLNMHGSNTLSLLAFAGATSSELAVFQEGVTKFVYLESRSGRENLMVLLQAANTFNHLKSTVGEGDATTRRLEESAICAVFLVALRAVFLNTGRDANPNTDTVYAKFSTSCIFHLVSKLHDALKTAEDYGRLRAVVRAHGGADGISGAYGLHGDGKGKGSGRGPGRGGGPGGGRGQGPQSGGHLPYSGGRGAHGGGGHGGQGKPSSAPGRGQGAPGGGGFGPGGRGRGPGDGRGGKGGKGGKGADGTPPSSLPPSRKPIHNYREAFNVFWAVIKSKGGLEYFDYYQIDLEKLLVRVVLLKVDETICESVHVRRQLTATSLDFILEIACDGVTPDGEKDIGYRKAALSYLRGAIDPSSKRYLDVLMNPIHHVPSAPSGGKPQAGPAIGKVLSISNVPDAAAEAAAAAVSAAAAAAAAAAQARADAAEEARFEARVSATVLRQMNERDAEIARQHQLWLQAQHQQMQRVYAAHGMQNQTFNPYGPAHGQGYAGGGAAASVQSQGAAGVLTKPQGGGWSSWDQSPSPSKE